jgi:hypothetical protein
MSTLAALRSAWLLWAGSQLKGLSPRRLLHERQSAERAARIGCVYHHGVWDGARGAHKARGGRVTAAVRSPRSSQTFRAIKSAGLTVAPRPLDGTAAHRRGRGEQVAALDRAGESSVCRAL